MPMSRDISQSEFFCFCLFAALIAGISRPAMTKTIKASGTPADA